MRRLILYIIFQTSLFFWGLSQTVGTLQISAETSDGLVLLHPINFDTTYLINNCGEKINQWPSELPNGTFAGLKSNGNLVKALQYNGAGYFVGGGRTGRIVEQDWNGALVWEYTLADSNYHLHHDVHVMSNGNLLVIAWERKSLSDCIAAGRNPSNIPPSGLWSEAIFEIEPQGSFTSVVWEWHAWDHLVQNFDSTKANYGDLTLNKSRIDINKGNTNSNSSDWIHINGIDYNESLDMIMLSAPMLNEIFIIDHGTTTLEAATNTGGNYGSGGDLMWRWGNPMNYDAGVPSDQQLFFQHDPQWVHRGTSYTNMISVFSNQEVDNLTDVSLVKLIEFPFDTINSFFPDLNDVFLPQNPFFEYQLADSLFSAHISGAEVQENNNLLIASGNSSTYIEIDSNQQVVWKYRIPIKVNGQIATQGETNINLARMFQATKYPMSFAGFVGKDLTPSSQIELNPIPCINTNSLIENKTFAIDVYPNPATDFVVIEFSANSTLRGKLYSIHGEVVREFEIRNGQNQISISSLPTPSLHPLGTC